MEPQQFAEAVLLEIQRASAIPQDKRLWRAEEIADYLRRSVSYTRNQITCLPSFPKAIRLPGNGRPLYRAKEVIKWAESFEEKN